jgi:hypothetical protein
MTRYRFPYRALILVMLVIWAANGVVLAQVQVIGSMEQSDSLTWTISSDTIDGVVAPGEVQSTTSYGEATQAYGGRISYSKVFGGDTRNMGSGQYNLNSQRALSFDGLSYGTGMGRMVSSEAVGMETVSTSPMYHNQVIAGSSFDLARGALTSNAQTRTVAATTAVPAELNYNVGLTGMPRGPGSLVPAVGSASAFMTIRTEQARGNSTQKSSDLQYSHFSGVNGLIGRFNQVMQYKSV